MVPSPMDTDAPVLIRNVSQHLTTSVSHSPGPKKENTLLSITQFFLYTHSVSHTHDMQMFYQSHLNGSIPGRVRCGVCCGPCRAGLQSGLLTGADETLLAAR